MQTFLSIGLSVLCTYLSLSCTTIASGFLRSFWACNGEISIFSNSPSSRSESAMLSTESSKCICEFVNKTAKSHGIHPFCLGLLLPSASTTQAHFVLRFQKLRWVSPLLFIGISQGVAAGIGTSNFARAAFIVSLNSSSFGSMKNIPLNCLHCRAFVQ